MYQVISPLTLNFSNILPRSWRRSQETKGEASRASPWRIMGRKAASKEETCWNLKWLKQVISFFILLFIISFPLCECVCVTKQVACHAINIWWRVIHDATLFPGCMGFRTYFYNDLKFQRRTQVIRFSSFIFFESIIVIKMERIGSMIWYYFVKMHSQNSHWSCITNLRISHSMSF